MAATKLAEKLGSALPYHFKEGAPFREFRKELLRDYAGRTTYPAYGDDDPEKQIVNLTMQAAEAFTMTLAASRPRFSVTSRYVQFEGAADRMGRALDRYAEELYLEEILQEIVRDSFTCVGIAKVYQAQSAAVGVEVDYRMDTGRPFVQRVCLDRFVWDTNATSPEEATFMGDYYTMSFREACRTRRFSPSARAKIRAAGPENYDNKGPDDRGEDLGRSPNNEPIDDTVYMVDVFVRHKKATYTFLCDRQMELRIDEPIQKIDWDGEECGPYYFLNMGPVPDHFMPSSPGQNQKLLCQFVNTLYRKLEAQSRRQKIVTYVEKQAPEDAETARDSKDGEVIELNNPNSVGQIRFDGPDQNIFGAAVHFNDQHSQACGNLKQKLGLAQSADTASQERMIGAMTNRLEAFFQQRYVSFVRNVAKGLSRLIFQDQKLRIPGYHTPEGTTVPIPDDWIGAGESYEDGSPSREGTYEQYRVDIDPYSMGYKSPGEQAAFLDAQVQKWMPALPMLAQMGVQPDLPAYFEEMAKLTSMSVLRRVFKTNQPPMVMQTAGGGGMSAGGGAQGEYLHRSVSNRSPESEAMQYFQSPQQGSAA